MPAYPTYSFLERRLDNGLRVIVSEDHSVPVVAVNIWYDVGSRHERSGKTGFAHLFEHMMFEGSEHAPKGTHFGSVQAAGGTLNATTWCDRTNYFDTVPSNHLDLVLWLEADRMGGLLASLTQETFDNQREVVKNERRQRYDNQPYGTWLEHLHRLVFPAGHPYHHATIGSMADLDASSLQDARDFYTTYYAPNNAVLSVVGDVEPDDAFASVARYFGGLAPREGIPPAPDGTLPPRIGAEVRETVPDRVPVPRVFLGYRCAPFGTAGYDAVVLLSALLGSGRGSRLYRELVLERQLAQPPDGAMMDSWGFVGGAALVIADLACREGVTAEELESAYHAVVEAVVAGVTDDELERARAMVASEWLHRLSSVDGRADTLSQYATLFGDPGLVNEQLGRLLSVSADDVVHAAGEVLRRDNLAVVTFVPDNGEAA